MGKRRTQAPEPKKSHPKDEIITVQLKPLGPIHKFLGCTKRMVSPLDQFYASGLDLAMTFKGDSGMVSIDTTKIYVNAEDGTLLYQNVRAYLRQFIWDDERAAQQTEQYWQQLGPVITEFIPKGYVGLERGYLFLHEEHAGSIPPRDAMN